MFRIIAIFTLVIVCFLGGVIFEKWYSGLVKPSEYETIMLKMPKTTKELQKAYLTAYAQVNMLEQLMMWDTKTKLMKGEKKDGK